MDVGIRKRLDEGWPVWRIARKYSMSETDVRIAIARTVFAEWPDPLV